MLEEGSLPIRQAFDDDAALAEERRLLYVGITRARRPPRAVVGRAARDARPRARRRPSRFLDGLVPRQGGGTSVAGRAVRHGASRDTDHAAPPMAFAAATRTRRRVAAAGGAPCLANAAGADDAVPAYVVAHDSTLAAIAEARPASLAALRRVKGMGPAKLERYGAEILEVVIASG